MAVDFRSPEELKELIKVDRPMKVLIAGMPRSGTMSLVTALKRLGYTPYDFVDRLLLDQMPLWDSALEAKFHKKGKPWGREELDRVVKGFDCVLDVPCTFFTAEFITHYPSCLVILNTRPPDPWLRSMHSTLFLVFQWRSWPLLAFLDPGFAGKWYRHIRLIFGIFCNNDYYGDPPKEAYLKHYEEVRRTVPRERLLEYRVQEGWEPLCAFLGKEVPVGEEFPRVNDTENFVKGHGRLWAYAVFNAVRNVGILGCTVGVGWLAWWMYRR
ncbi:MAG: hypothetical protein Q9220_001814 [cf. Caloplaca sp. 1 TL-2023]